MTKTLIKVQLGAKKKYVKLEDVCFSDFVSAFQETFLIPEDTILKVTDDHGVEVDDDVFPELAAREICFVIYTDDELPLTESSSNSADCSDKTEYVTLDLSVVQQGGEIPSSPSLTDTASVSSSLSSDTSDLGCKRSESLDSNYARNTVEQILTSKPAGMTVIKEYEETGSLKDSTRRLMVNIIVVHMREKEGSRVSKATKEFHALGIVFPALKDPYSNKGYEHFYNIQSNKGFLEWRLKTVQCQSRTASSSLKKVVLKGGPTSSRPTVVTTGDQQTGDDCMEAISLLNHTTDRDLVFHKMRDTFQYCQQILHNPQHSADVLQIFPRFLDIRLILQDLSLMFGEETASRFLRKWNTSFKDKVTQEAKNLKETSLLKRHLRSALNEGSDTTDDPGTSNVVEQSIVLDCLFCAGTQENSPLFSKIASIILHNDQVVFALIEHETFFHDHFHVYQVSECIPRKILVIEREQLRHFKCFDAQMSYGCDSQFYVVSENCII
ncbi:uncharacterized protein LOC115787108 [Archocentrus centrarchus]|uniref:uncharacterized protein LOC115787108 n=1 Tax=Archocentrus centrarchus TaxID=63155 RepID=UPI0011EA3D9B|nr:uncharacterized protein LOC115787108 [Archocentrus centrarchus]XP_030595541.1 uncharacterized protein LOC115787108 [Archocentrus centrarchus]XP_030595542.1 uncharacterized protein LOC115787108 [Archocentrus centrarchus]